MVSRYGKKIRTAFETVSKKAKLKQRCPYCKKLSAKRLAKGIWQCRACKRRFAERAYYIE